MSIYPPRSGERLWLRVAVSFVAIVPSLTFPPTGHSLQETVFAAPQQPQGQIPHNEEAGQQSLKNVSQQTTPARPAMTLAGLEKMALEANPTLAQAEAAIRAAEGRRVQAGLWPNPIMGYAGEELSTRAFTEKSEHYFFAEQ